MTKESTAVQEQLPHSLLVGIHIKSNPKDESMRSLHELRELAETAGYKVEGEILVSRDSLDPNYLIGTGKADDILAMARDLSAKIIIFDIPLNPIQGRNLEEHFNLKLMDRVEIILDIFSKHASSHEAKIQIELAQLRYSLPRLTRMWTHLSRQEGAMGVRGGPGEKQIEIDRRRIKDKMHLLNERLSSIEQNRHTQRKSREKNHIPRFTIVGYTNAGKSSLLNKLTDAGALVKDQLFSTLDSLSRKLVMPGGKDILLTDTVGFIRNLPHFLIEAFKSTLEEVHEAECLLHIVDASAPDYRQKMESVISVLYDELKIEDKRIIKVMNKCDLLSDERKRELEEDIEGAVLISAKTGEGIDGLIRTLDEVLKKMLKKRDFFIPMKEMGKKDFFYGHSTVLNENYTEKGVEITAEVDDHTLSVMRNYLVNGDEDFPDS